MYHCTELSAPRGCAVEAVLPNASLLFRDRTPTLEGDLFESTLDLPSTRWEHLWIDVGGEG